MFKSFTIFLIVCFMFTTNFTFATNASRNRRSMSSIRTAGTRAIPKQQTIVETEKTPEASETSKTLADIACDRRFNMCMDTICLNEQEIRYNCSDSLDSFESVERDGNKVRLGNDLYTYAKGSCSTILSECELKDRHDIETAYTNQILADYLTKGYLDVMAYTGEPAAIEASQKYIDCMKPLCGHAFQDCFAVTAIERRASKCSSVLKTTARPFAVRKNFYEQIEAQFKLYCAASGGRIDTDKQICRVKVVFGKPEVFYKQGQAFMTGYMEFGLASREFNIGEMVECTQEYFGVFYEENPGFIKGLIKVHDGIQKVVAGIVVLVVSLGSQAGAGVELITGGVADGLEGGVVLAGGEKSGACYIKGKRVAMMNEYFRINFVQ